MRAFGRDLVRGGHYGQRSCEPHLKAEHMAAPTNAAYVKKALANSEPSTHDPGCVKTRFGKGRAELFSQLPSCEGSCQHNRLPHRQNRDGSSTEKLDIGVFTQPGPLADIEKHFA